MLHILKDWIRLQRSQWMSKEVLTEIQSRKLRAIVNFAFRTVPFYHKLYKNKGVDIHNITDAESINKLPIITKQDLRNSSIKERTSVGINSRSYFLRTTSGTTGPPITFLDDLRSKCYFELLKSRRYWAIGVRPFHKVAWVSPQVVNDVASSNFHWTPNNVPWRIIRRTVRAIRMLNLSNPNMYNIVEFLSQWKPQYISASPFHFKTLIRLSEKVGQALSIKAAFTRWEVLEDQTRKYISDSLHTDVFDSYGALEAGNIAWECPTHSGYHINAESVVLEILRDGEPVSSNEPGEVYVTTLWRKTMPMIRYYLGDVVTPLGDECPCGRGLPLLKNIKGRILDMDVTSNGKLIRRGPKKELKSFIL